MNDEHLFENSASDRMIAGWEIVSVVISFLIAEWIVRPFSSHDRLTVVIPMALALVVIVSSHRARGETLRMIGWRLDNFWPAFRLVVVLVVSASFLIVIGGYLTGGFGSEKWREWRWLLWLPVWALLQQYVLQGFINRRAQIAFGAGYRSVILVAAVFALLHLPNPWLTLATFVVGAASALIYQRVPNLPALALGHALLSWLLVWAVPSSVLGSLRVGIRYFL